MYATVNLAASANNSNSLTVAYNDNNARPFISGTAVAVASATPNAVTWTDNAAPNQLFTLSNWFDDSAVIPSNSTKSSVFSQ